MIDFSKNGSKKKSSFKRDSKKVDTFKQLEAVKRTFKGFRSADSLAAKFGGVNAKDESLTEEVVFTIAEVVQFTRELVSDPVIVPGPATARKLINGSKDRPHEVVPGLFVGTDKWKELVLTLIDKLEAAVPKSETEEGFTDFRAVPSDWKTLRSRSDAAMRPEGYPICSNLTASAPTGPISDRHSKILDATVKALFCTKWQPKSGYEISKISSSGFPDFEYSVEYKMDAFFNIANNFEDVMSYVHDGDLRGLAQAYPIVFAYFINRRRQNDGVKDDLTVKPRSGPSVGQSIGVEPGILYAGRELPGEPGFFASRSRVVYAGNGPLNYFISAGFAPLRDYYLNEFKFSFKHTSAENISKKLAGWIPVGVDASQFDQKFPTWFADKIFDLLEEHTFSKDFVDICRLTWKMPAFCPSPVIGEPNQWAWLGNPFDLKTFKANRGLPSGIAYNPDFGKAWGIGYLLCMLDDIFGDVLEFGVEKVMKGEHNSYAILNMGDDALILVRDPALKQVILTSLESGEASPYVKLDIESPITFLGWVISRNGDEYRVYPNIISMVVNFICNEHSVGDPRAKIGHRKHWALGIESWEQVFGTCPEYEKVRNIVETVFLKITGKTLREHAAPFAELSREIQGLTGLNSAESRFLEKPERRFYSVDKDEIRSSILEEVVRTISPDEIQQTMSRFVKPELLAA